MEYTDEYIEELITCSKRITEPPPKEMKKERGHWKKSFGLESEDGEHRFTAFIRYNDEFNENFSVGLVYNPRDRRDKIHLLRCNGPHGGTIEWDHHDKPHIHRAKLEMVNQELNSETYIEITNRYTSRQEALQYFLRRVNIKGAAEFLPPPESDLFD
jgi:hypothetical protein